MFCKKCGEKIPVGGRLCNNCGAMVPASAVTAPKNTPSNSQSLTRSTQLRPTVKTRNLTEELINQYQMDMVRFVHITVSPGYENELAFANTISKRLKELLRDYKVDAELSNSLAICGTGKHPMVEIDNYEYGCIGLLITRNIVRVLKVRFGKVTQLKIDLQKAEESAKRRLEYHDQRTEQNFSQGGFMGLVAGTAHINASSKATDEINRIKALKNSYDPTDIVFEQAWEKDVMSCINQICNDDSLSSLLDSITQ